MIVMSTVELNQGKTIFIELDSPDFKIDWETVEKNFLLKLK